MKTIRPRAHALVARAAVTLSLVFALGMVVSHMSRPGAGTAATAQSPVR